VIVWFTQDHAIANVTWRLCQASGLSMSWERASFEVERLTLGER